MLQPFMRDPDYLSKMADGTVKQLNPFSGTEVWTVAGRGNRPLGIQRPEPVPLDPGQLGRHCPFCEQRYLETPPEKSRVVQHDDGRRETIYRTMAENLFATTAEFRRVPNLFEILSYQYWNLNYGYELPARVAERKAAYLASAAGRQHVLGVARTKLKAGGKTDAQIDAMTEAEIVAFASGFFGGGHDVIIPRRHFVDGATDSSHLAGSGTMTPDQHAVFVSFTVESIQALLELNRYARYVVVFQNWLKPAGASFDHLHKQLVAIDERGVQTERAIARLRTNPNVFNDDAVNYASYKNLILAENDHAIAFAGFGHRYPSVEIYSKSENPDPWEQTPEELRGVSDIIHAMHAATGVDIPSNEEWHYRPVDVDLAMPWRIILKWRISTVAGFEGATKIYLNTLDPYAIRDRVVPRLFALRDQGKIARGLHIATECPCRPNSLRYRDRHS
jgi:galactose-1-phosphate uridylyltransferase